MCESCDFDYKTVGRSVGRFYKTLCLFCLIFQKNQFNFYVFEDYEKKTENTSLKLLIKWKKRRQKKYDNKDLKQRKKGIVIIIIIDHIPLDRRRESSDFGVCLFSCCCYCFIFVVIIIILPWVRFYSFFSFSFKSFLLLLQDACVAILIFVFVFVFDEQMNRRDK